MAKPTKNQIASATLTIAIVCGGGVTYAGNTPEKENIPTDARTTSVPIPNTTANE